MNPKPRAIIADDEEELRKYLKTMLESAWPDLEICSEAKNGVEAVEQIIAHKPDIAFLDIKMPGMTGLEVAREIVGTCWVVFVTAYDQYAVTAFENQAIDYLLKPVSAKRLEQTVARLKNRFEQKKPLPDQIPEAIQTLLSNVSGSNQPEYLKWIRAQHGDGIRLIPVEDIFCFKSEDKYTCVLTRTGESLIRTPIKTLALELNPDEFWQIHRGAIVRVDQIDRVSRSLTGRHVVKLKDFPEPLTVSRAFSHFFKQM